MNPAPKHHEALQPTAAVSLIPGLLSALLPNLAADEPITRTPGPFPHKEAPLGRFRAITELPDDPKLPALVALRDACRADTPHVFSARTAPPLPVRKERGEGHPTADTPAHLRSREPSSPQPSPPSAGVEGEECGALNTCDAPPVADLDGRTIELLLCGYSRGSRATLEARAGNRRLAVKAYADDAAPEAALYEALAAAGLAGDSGARLPPLLFWERELRVLVIGWLEGRTAHQLVKDGRGARAGELAAHWLQRAASLSVPLGPPFAGQRVQSKVANWVSALYAADAALGTAATAVAARLERTQPREDAPRLIHGTFYARHIYDLGDGPGVIDWQRFGQGPLELDAGMFLATIGRVGLDHEKLAGEAGRAEDAFLAGTRGLLDERVLAWYRATALLHLAARRVRHPERRIHRDGLVERARALLGEAARQAEVAR